MPGFAPPARDIRSHGPLALSCVLAAAVCIVGLLVIGFHGSSAAVLKQGQSTWIPTLDQGAR